MLCPPGISCWHPGQLPTWSETLQGSGSWRIPLHALLVFSVLQFGCTQRSQRRQLEVSSWSLFRCTSGGCDRQRGPLQNGSPCESVSSSGFQDGPPVLTLRRFGVHSGKDIGISCHAQNKLCDLSVSKSPGFGMKTKFAVKSIHFA